MHSKKSRRWLKLLTATFGLTALVGVSFTLPSEAVSPTPTPYCSDGTCWVTFDYTGDYSVWTPPTGIDSLHFDVYGAQGGRAGGKGGHVSGNFSVIPASLYVYVGGAGSMGNGAFGGFNGGGTAGSGHADQGSGGGASDLRTSTIPGDRVVVAGGGGGTGGWIGGAGGAGGNTIASAGTKGATAGTAGGGGTQTAGGSLGLGVTTGNGTAGILGLGGTGGTGTVAGGGGGGGGFYGGGGGGSDNVSGGSDGAGGGGGSSFATLALTTDVAHQAGVRVGSGQVTLRYTFPPKVTGFQPTSSLVSTTGSATYELQFNQFVTGLTPWSFSMQGTAAGCYVTGVTGSGYNFSVSVSGCSQGTLKLILNPNSVLGASMGPTQSFAASSDIQFDSTPPTFTLESPASPISSSELTFVLSGQESFKQPTASAFALQGSGCEISNIQMVGSSSTGSAASGKAEITVSNCNSGANVYLSVNPNSIEDDFGNLGPVSSVAGRDVLVDYEAPQVTSITSVSLAADITEFTVQFSESVTELTEQSFNVSGSGCEVIKFDGSGQTYRVYLDGCLEAPTLTVKANAARDQAGNRGPNTDSGNQGQLNDQTPPSATLTELGRDDLSESPTFELRFDEQVSGLDLNSFSRNGTAKNCSFNLEPFEEGRVYHFVTNNCSAGSLRLVLLADAVADLHGNLGPSQNVESALIKIATAAEPQKTNSGTASMNELGDTAPVSFIPEQPSDNQNIPPFKGSPETPTETLPATKTAGSLLDLKSESWVAIAIALISLAIAKRPRGRRRA